jgi:hypothetical protein
MVRAEQCARASTAGASVFSPEFICQLPASEPSYILVIAPMSAKLLVIIGTRRCVYTTAVLHDLAESMGLRGYYPSDRRITSCPKTRLYLIIFFVSSSSTILQRLKCLCHFPAHLANCTGSLLQRTPVYSPQVPSCFSAHGSSSTCTTSSS